MCTTWMYCQMMFCCVAVCCSVLQCVAVCCSVLQCVATCCSVLQCVAVCGTQVCHLCFPFPPPSFSPSNTTAFAVLGVQKLLICARVEEREQVYVCAFVCAYTYNTRTHKTNHTNTLHTHAQCEEREKCAHEYYNVHCSTSCNTRCNTHNVKKARDAPTNKNAEAHRKAHTATHTATPTATHTTTHAATLQRALAMPQRNYDERTHTATHTATPAATHAATDTAMRPCNNATQLWRKNTHCNTHCNTYCNAHLKIATSVSRFV